MRKVILTAISILAIVMVSLSTASAEKRHIVFEMGESGQVVSFPMTSDEIVAHEAENTRRVNSKALNSKQTAPRFKTIEMGESGQLVSFLMTPEEIAAEDAENRSIYKTHKNSSVDETQTVSYEMAETGVMIVFPERTSEDHTVYIAKMENL